MLAGWQSGDAADCKSVYPGSIPGSASIFKTKKDPKVLYSFKFLTKMKHFAKTAKQENLLILWSHEISRNKESVVSAHLCSSDEIHNI